MVSNVTVLPFAAELFTLYLMYNTPCLLKLVRAFTPGGIFSSLHLDHGILPLAN